MRYAAQRFAQFVVVFLVVTFIILWITRLGTIDPARDLAGGLANEDVIERLREQYHLDSSIFVQYWYWLGDILRFDLGITGSQSVNDLLKDRFPSTIFISLWAIVLGLVIAVPAALLSAYRRDRRADRIISGVSFGGLSLPPVVLAVLLSYFVALQIGYFPVDSDYVALWSNPVEHFRNFFLPSLTLAVGIGAVWTRILRADLILTLQSDFIMLARAKGVSPRRILWVHAFRNSALSLITAVALQLGSLIGGAVVVEQIFAMPGVGYSLVDAISRNDLFLVQAIVAILALTVVAVNLLVDLFYAVIDPRIRHARAVA